MSRAPEFPGGGGRLLLDDAKEMQIVLQAHGRAWFGEEADEMLKALRHEIREATAPSDLLENGEAAFEDLVGERRAALAKHDSWPVLNAGDLEQAAQAARASGGYTPERGLNDRDLELHAEMAAVSQELAARAPNLLDEVVHLGPTPALVMAANTALHPKAASEGYRGVARAIADTRRSRITLHRITPRPRSSRCPAAGRRRGSRRVASRSAGGGSSGDDPPGEPEPARRRGPRGETQFHKVAAG